MRLKVIEASSKKVKHFITSSKDSEKNIVVDIFRLVNVLSAGSVRLLATEAGHGGSEDDNIARFRFVKN